MDERADSGCEALQRRVAEVEAQLRRLTQLLEEQRRAGKRQAAPFANRAATGRQRCESPLSPDRGSEDAARFSPSC
jgi:hypothetical protein